MIRQTKKIALLMALGVFATPLALAQSPVMKTKSDIAEMHNYQDYRLETLINPNENRSIGKRFSFLNRRLSITGLLRVDTVYASRGWNRSSPASPGVISSVVRAPHSSDISVNNMNLLIDGKVNAFTTFHGSLVFADLPGPGPFQDSEEASSDCKGRPRFTVDEAYITLGQLNSRTRGYMPFYLRVGREYLPFGHYRDPYPLTYSFTQLLSQTNANVVQLGFVMLRNGLYGNVFGFNGPYSGPVDSDDNVSSSRIRNWGAKLGYRNQYGLVRYELSGSFLREFRDTDFYVNTFVCDDLDSSSRRASSFSLYGAARRGPLNFMVNYVAAVKTVFPGDNVETRPWAYTLLGGYRFYTYGRMSKLMLSYQRTGGVLFGDFSVFPEDIAWMPKYRLQATYKLALGRYTALMLQYNYNRSFRTTTDLGSNEAKARLSVHF